MMFKKTLPVLMATLLAALLLTGAAFAAGVTLELSSPTAKTGAAVTVSGTADPDNFVSIKILDSAAGGDNKQIVFYDAVKSDSAGSYSLTFKVPSVQPGILTIVAGYGDNVATAALSVTKPSSGGGGGGGGGTSVPPAVPPEEKPLPPEEIELEPAAVLTDVAGHWAEESIKTLLEKGALAGYPDNSFRPDNGITRAEFAAVLIKAFDLEPKAGKVFSDTAGHWAKDVIATAQAHGIAGGYSETAFGPDDPITREQMAIMIVKAAGLETAGAALAFSDSGQIAAWAREAVAAAAGAGLLKGYPDGSFQPQGKATRAEAVTMIVKTLE